MKKLLHFSMLIIISLMLSIVAAMAECNHDFYMANTTKPTCTSDGYYILKCHNCGYSKKEITDGAWGITGR